MTAPQNHLIALLHPKTTPQHYCTPKPTHSTTAPQKHLTVRLHPKNHPTALLHPRTNTQHKASIQPYHLREDCTPSSGLKCNSIPKPPPSSQTEDYSALKHTNRILCVCVCVCVFPSVYKHTNRTLCVCVCMCPSVFVDHKNTAQPNSLSAQGNVVQYAVWAVTVWAHCSQALTGKRKTGEAKQRSDQYATENRLLCTALAA